MRIALLGNGKTGSCVVRLAEQDGHKVSIFNTGRVPNLELLEGHDVIVSFLPGEAFLNYISVLLESRIPVISGSTGFNWPDEPETMSSMVDKMNSLWVHSGNFSLGNLVLLPTLRLLSQHLAISQFQPMMKEWHHINKKDSPSGTALLWMDAIGRKLEIQSFREGDIVGIHELTLSSDTEKITIRHEVSNRDVFAKGALFLADYIVRNRSFIRSGLYSMQELIESYQHLN
jgi:4-hydroxy-tetrahydrodipicolinate reductase